MTFVSPFPFLLPPFPSFSPPPPFSSFSPPPPFSFLLSPFPFPFPFVFCSSSFLLSPFPFPFVFCSSSFLLSPSPFVFSPPPPFSFLYSPFLPSLLAFFSSSSLLISWKIFFFPFFPKCISTNPINESSWPLPFYRSIPLLLPFPYPSPFLFLPLSLSFPFPFPSPFPLSVPFPFV